MRAVIYCRISDDRTGLAAGVKRQEADARSLCERNGWDVVAVEVDNDISASRYTRKIRPGYRRVLEMAQSGEVEVIACYDVDRLYRRPVELEELIDVAERTTIASVQGDFRLDTSDGRAVARVLAAMAAKSSDDTSRRVARKHQERAEAGLPAIGRLRPFGFERDGVTVRESEAVRVREASARVLFGDSLGSICRDWEAAGVMTPPGNRWGPGELRRMLMAPRVAGLRAVRGQVVADAVWPALVERETWESVRAILGRRAGVAAQSRSYLLSGLLFCGECGAALRAGPTTNKGIRYRRYMCRAASGGCNRVGISADRSEDFVVSALLVALLAEDGFSLGDEIDTASDDGEMARLDALRGALADSLAAGTLDVSAYESAVRGVARREADARARLAQSRTRTALSNLLVSVELPAPWAELDEARRAAALADARAVWDRLPFDRRRVMIAEGVERITLAKSSGRGAGFESERIQITKR